MAESPEERLTRLESHVAHLEKVVEELNRVVIEQGKTIGRLQGLAQKNSQVIESLELDRIRDNNAPPPHYGR